MLPKRRNRRRAKSQHFFWASSGVFLRKRTNTSKMMTRQIDEPGSSISFAKVSHLLQKVPLLHNVSSQTSSFLGDCQDIITKIFPNWSSDDIAFTVCTEGITNKLMKVSHKDSSLLIRMYGEHSEILIDRENELLVFLAAFS